MSTDFVMKILTLGDTAVGKTSIINRYMKSPMPKKGLSTIGVDFKSKNVTIDNNTIKIVLWDTVGQERFRNIATNYYNGTDCALLVFDLTSEESFKVLDFWVEGIKERKRMDDVCLLLVGNKSDLEEERAVTQQMIDKYTQVLGIRYFEVSAEKNKWITDYLTMRLKRLWR